MSLSVLSNGEVTICERALNRLLIIGNVTQSSLMDIWNSRKLYDIVEPNRKFYKSSECYDCEKYTDCITKKGACYARVLMVHNEMFNIDPSCPKSKDNIVLV